MLTTCPSVLTAAPMEESSGIPGPPRMGTAGLQARMGRRRRGLGWGSRVDGVISTALPQCPARLLIYRDRGGAERVWCGSQKARMAMNLWGWAAGMVREKGSLDLQAEESRLASLMGDLGKPVFLPVNSDTGCLWVAEMMPVQKPAGLPYTCHCQLLTRYCLPGLPGERGRSTLGRCPGLPGPRGLWTLS